MCVGVAFQTIVANNIDYSDGFEDFALDAIRYLSEGRISFCPYTMNGSVENFFLEKFLKISVNIVDSDSCKIPIFMCNKRPESILIVLCQKSKQRPFILPNQLTHMKKSKKR